MQEVNQLGILPASTGFMCIPIRRKSVHLGHEIPRVGQVVFLRERAGAKCEKPIDQRSRKMKAKYLLMLFGVASLAGCAHSTMRGSVAMKGNDEEAHVCMGDKEVKPGDKVALFKNVCTSPKAAGRNADGGGFGGCKKVKLGEGVVERTLNEHYSVVKVNPGVQFEEGTIVEKE